MVEPGKESTRNRVIQELLSTERTYVRRLKVVVDIFITPLRSSGILSTAEVHVLIYSFDWFVNTLVLRIVERPIRVPGRDCSNTFGVPKSIGGYPLRFCWKFDE